MTIRVHPDWLGLRARHPEAAVNVFRRLAQSGGRIEISREELLGRGNFTGPQLDSLLDELVSLGWLKRRERTLCPCCHKALSEPLPDDGLCPHCGQAFVDCGEPATEALYFRHEPSPRIVDWVLSLHGMNTLGAWQEKLNWLVARTYGRAVPVVVYKYGMVRPGVLFRFRHRQLRRQVAERLRSLSAEAESAGYRPEPDVIAHSFGTLLLARALEADETLRVGRVILAGSILRPDFDWRRLIDRGQVDAVLNHYGTADGPVAATHFLIPDSGPAGRRGFDTPGVINVEAKDFGHSTVFGDRLDSVFQGVWRPFLSAKDPGALDLPEIKTPAWPWTQAPWGIRAGVARFALLAILAAIALFLGGSWAFGVVPFLRWVSQALGAAGS